MDVEAGGAGAGEDGRKGGVPKRRRRMLRPVVGRGTGFLLRVYAGNIGRWEKCARGGG